MTPLAQRIAVAELDGFQWYWRYDSWNTAENRANWRAMLAYPDQEGIGCAAWIGTVSETRHMTAAEIETAKRGPMRTINQFGYTDGFATYAPDYLNDLNVLHKLEMKMTDEQTWRKYVNLLYSLVGYSGDKMIRADATQRSQAILKALNKWDDTK